LLSLASSDDENGNPELELSYQNNYVDLFNVSASECVDYLDNKELIECATT
jgi:hypothetical protein